MEVFHKANKSSNLAVTLKSHHNKFLLPELDGDAAVKQHGNGTTAVSRWSVEIADGGTHVRLKSLKTSMYLTATNDPFLVGLTPKRVNQAFDRTDSAEWAPVKEGGNGRLMMRSRATGTYLCANGSLPPWRNAVTHDSLCKTANLDWAVWVVEVVEKDSDSDSGGKGASAVTVMRRTCSVPANSVEDGGKGSFSPAGSVRSVRTMAPRRQSTKTASSTSFNSRDREPIVDDNKPLPPEVQKAKRTFMEVQGLDFETVFYSMRLKDLEASISVLLSYNMINNNDNYTRLTTNSKLLTLRDQLQALKTLDKKRDTNELNAYEEFKERKENMKVELQREVAKARELQCRETELAEVLVKARRKRVELMRELEMAERKIKIGEEEEERNEKKMEELCRVIGWRSEIVKEMEGEEKMWMKRKVMAKTIIKEVEDHWAIIKDSF